MSTTAIFSEAAQNRFRCIQQCALNKDPNASPFSNPSPAIMQECEKQCGAPNTVHHVVTPSAHNVVPHSAHHAGHVVSKKHDNETPKIVAGVVVGVLILVMIVLLAKRK